MKDSELLDGAGATGSLDVFNALDVLNSLRDEVIWIFSESFVELGWRQRGGVLMLVTENSHDDCDQLKDEEANKWKLTKKQ